MGKFRKVKVRLVGEDGNGFAIIGRVRNALKRAGYEANVISEYTIKAMGGDYDHLLQVTLEYADEIGGEDNGIL